jgi:hypothetical protein
MHADDVEAADMLTEWRKAPGNKNISKAGDDRSPSWTWQTYTYRDAEGYVAMPADNLMVCLRQAGAKMILKKQTTFKAISQSGLLIADEMLEFRNGGKKLSAVEMAAWRDEPFSAHKKHCEAMGFNLLVKRAAVGSSKHVRVRPMFSAWMVTGTIQILAQEITFENLEMLFDLAGHVGLCDWRPGCKTPGRFGMFEAKVSKG